MQTVTEKPQIREGFPGQRSAVLPRSVVSSWLLSDPLFELVPSDAGYFPDAQWHYVDRPDGSNQLILIYCQTGEGWVRVGDEEIAIKSGQVLLIPPLIPHAYGANPENPWTIYWTHLAGRKTENMLRKLDHYQQLSVLILYPGSDLAMPPIFERILHILEIDYSESSLQSASTMAHQLATYIISLRHRSADGNDAHSAKIKKTIQLMNSAIDQKLTIDQLAQQANMSKSHFAFIFKDRMGYSPLDYFMRLKMQRACICLDTTSLPIKVIASDLGFQDSLYFSRRFRSIHNCSPSEYRAAQKG